MSLYINNNQDMCKINQVFINPNGQKKTVISIWVSKDGIPTKVFSKNNELQIVTWSEGTDAQIAAMLDAHYAGDINIHDYWKVGDERTVHLNAMPAEYVSESHAEQDVTMVLMNAGGKTLVEPVNGKQECAFVVGQKENLIEVGYINKSTADLTMNGGWSRCDRRTWCNEIYRNAFYETFRNLFKRHKNYTGDMANLLTKAYDYFSLPSEKEVFGTVIKAEVNAEEYNKQFIYYQDQDNRLKMINNERNYAYWLRSRSSGVNLSNKFCVALPGDNDCGTDYWSCKYGISPFGCI